MLASNETHRGVTARLGAVVGRAPTHLQMALRQGFTSACAFGPRLAITKAVADAWLAMFHADAPADEHAKHLSAGLLVGNAMTAFSIPLGHQLAEWLGRRAAVACDAAELVAKPAAKWSSDRLRDVIFLGVFAANAGLTEGEEELENTLARSFAAGFIASGLWSLAGDGLEWLAGKSVDMSRPNFKEMCVKLLSGGALYAGSGYVYGRIVSDLAGPVAPQTRLAKACGSLVRLSAWLLPRPMFEAAYAPAPKRDAGPVAVDRAAAQAGQALAAATATRETSEPGQHAPVQAGSLSGSPVSARSANTGNSVTIHSTPESQWSTASVASSPSRNTARNSGHTATRRSTRIAREPVTLNQTSVPRDLTRTRFQSTTSESGASPRSLLSARLPGMSTATGRPPLTPSPPSTHQHQSTE